MNLIWKKKRNFFWDFENKIDIARDSISILFI